MGTGMADGNVAEEVGVIMFSFAPALAEPLHYQLTLKPYWGACLWRFPCQDGYIPTTQREIAEIPLTPPVHHPNPNTAFAVRIQKAGGIFEQCPILLGFNELGWDNWCVCSTQKHTHKQTKQNPWAKWKTKRNDHRANQNFRQDSRKNSVSSGVASGDRWPNMNKGMKAKRLSIDKCDAAMWCI